MNWTYITAALAISLVFVLLPLLAWGKKSKKSFESKNLPYRRRVLMTPTELDVYAILLSALPDYMIFTQVQVSRVLEVPSNKDTYYWFNFISRLSYDFVICRVDSTPIAAIEIDDATHNRPDRVEADNRKDLATLAAGVAMIRWKVGETPSDKEILRIIKKLDKQAQ